MGNQIKKSKKMAITGNASKDQVAKILQNTLSIKVMPKNLDGAHL